MTRFRWACGLSILTAILTYGLICWGGIVHNTGSSLACPDWPTCFGQLVPDTSEMTPDERMGIFWEHGHRTLGTLVGMCSIGLCLLLWGRHPRMASLRGPALLLLGLVVFQGVLGGVTVLLELNSAISTFHLGTSMLVLMLVLFLTRASWRRGWDDAQGAEPIWPAEASASARSWILAALVVVYLQVVLGAAVRHTGATWAAGIGPQAALLGKDPTTGLYVFLSSNAFTSLNLIHRYVALIAAVVVMVCCTRAWSKLGRETGAGWALLIWLPVGLVAAQILFGVGMIAMNFDATMRTVHLAVATLLLANLYWVYQEVHRSALGVASEASESAAGGLGMPQHT